VAFLVLVASAPARAGEPAVSVDKITLAGRGPQKLERGVRRAVLVSYIARQRGQATVRVVISKGRWKWRLEQAQPAAVHTPGIWRWSITTRPPTTLPAGQYTMKATVVLVRAGKRVGSDVSTRRVLVT
jgi:hypothetical protein